VSNWDVCSKISGWVQSVWQMLCTHYCSSSEFTSLKCIRLLNYRKKKKNPSDSGLCPWWPWKRIAPSYPTYDNFSALSLYKGKIRCMFIWMFLISFWP
jgi:hypothetical protein